MHICDHTSPVLPFLFSLTLLISPSHNPPTHTPLLLAPTYTPVKSPGRPASRLHTKAVWKLDKSSLVGWNNSVRRPQVLRLVLNTSLQYCQQLTNWTYNCYCNVSFPTRHNIVASRHIECQLHFCASHTPAGVSRIILFSIQNITFIFTKSST